MFDSETTTDNSLPEESADFSCLMRTVTLKVVPVSTFLY